MNNKKIKEIVKFSLRKNIQNKWFVILNVLIFAIILISLNAQNIKEFLEEKNINLFDEQLKIQYIDNDNLIGNSLETAFRKYENIEVEKIFENNYTKEDIENNIVVEVSSDKTETLKAKLISKEVIDGEIFDKITEVLDNKKIEIFSKENGIEKSKLKNLEKGVPVERIMLGVDSNNSEQKEIIEYVSTIVVYMVSIFIFSKIANDIAQEKVSKSIEYVLTSVSAKEYLFAKIVSIVLVVLLQGVYLVVYYFIGNLVNSLINMSYLNTAKLNVSGAIGNFDIDLMKYVLVVFTYGVLTIILMSIIQAALSSKTTSMQEAGNSMMFLLTITVGVYMLTFALINPYTNMSIYIYILSCIPLVSNFFIPAIMIIGQATMLQMIVSLSLLVVSIPIAFNICSKVFKDGVLDYKQNKKRHKKAKKELSLLEEQELKLEKAKFRRLGFVISLGLILFIVLEVFATILLNLFFVPGLNKILDKVTVDLISQMLVSIIGLGTAALFVNLYISKPKVGNPISKKDAKKLFIMSIFIIGFLQITLTLIEFWLGVDNDVSELLLNSYELGKPLNCLLFFIEIAVVPAIFEELFFRKCIIDLSRGYGDKFAVVFSSLIFGVSHLNFSQAFFAFFMGLVLGTLYVRTKTMKYNILLHLINNGYAVIAEILLYNKFKAEILIFEIIVFVTFGISAEVFIEKLIEKKKNKEKVLWLEGRLIPKNFKYILTDYTVIITLILVVLLFTATEAVLSAI